jgi:hypothetical protein
MLHQPSMRLKRAASIVEAWAGEGIHWVGANLVFALVSDPLAPT